MMFRLKKYVKRMLVRVVKEFDLKSNGVSLVGSNPAVSVSFTAHPKLTARDFYTW